MTSYNKWDKTRISLQMKEIWKDPEYRKRQSLVHKKMVVPEERKKRISMSIKKIWATEDGRKKLLENRTGSPMKGKITTEETKRKQSLARKGKYCGKNCPSWRGGISFEPYCILFNNEFRERVRTFFGYVCVECGKTQNENKERLHVHHVNFRKDSCCAEDAPRLFVPLCNSCHSRSNYNRFFWEYWFTEMINYLYDGRCYFSKEEMMLESPVVIYEPKHETYRLV